MKKIAKVLEFLQTALGAGEGVFIVIGIISVIVGILVDIFFIRVLCLIVLTGSGVLLFTTFRAKQLDIQIGFSSAKSFFRSHSKSEMMKKLIFDDFQSHSEENPEGNFSIESIPVTQQPTGHHAFSQTVTQTKAGAVSPEERDFGASVVQKEFAVSDFFDIGSEIYKSDSEPRTEFDFLLNKVLAVIKEALFAHTVAFFWANREKNQMVLEARITESADFFASRRFPIGQDLISNVALTGKPEFINEVNPMSEMEMFRYYDRPALVKSFIGVPVYFSKSGDNPAMDQPVAVIAVDSKASDDFGPETLLTLGKFTKLISALIKSYNDKYDLLLDSELLSSIRRLQDRVRTDFSLGTIIQSLAEETSKLINWDFLSIVLYDESKHAWVTQKVTNRTSEGFVLPGQIIDFPDSLVGQVIRTNAHCNIDDVETSSSVRYYTGEKFGYAGSILSVPIISLNKCYGALTIESKEKFNFSRRDVEILYRLAENTASALEIYYMQDVINEYVIIDAQTGMYSKKFFLQKLEEELERADDAANELSMIFITVDKAADVTQRFTRDGFERVMLALAKAIRAGVRSYDIVGRFDANRFGILLVNTAANDAYLWAEKIRKNLAGLVINLDGKTFSITISIGVCGVLEGMRKEDLVGNTAAVLNKATEAGGNVVRVY